MKDSILIVGGSPFVNEVDLKRIDFEKYDILAINRPPLGIPVKFLVAHDTDFRAVHSQQEVQAVLKQGLNPVFIAPKTEFIHETTGWKWKFDYISHSLEEKCLGFCLYTCSSALNFAYLKGYKNIYFVGVDLKEDNKPFTHWHGIVNNLGVPITCAKQAKEYLYQYKKWVNLYQVNPTVKDEWLCEYCPKEKLYDESTAAPILI